MKLNADFQNLTESIRSNHPHEQKNLFFQKSFLVTKPFVTLIALTFSLTFVAYTSFIAATATEELYPVFGLLQQKLAVEDSFY